MQKCRFVWSRSGSACGLSGCGAQSLPDLVRALGDKPALSELRKLGESTAARYPGYVDMGMSPLKPVRQVLGSGLGFNTPGNESWVPDSPLKELR